MSALAYRSQAAFSAANPINEAANLFKEYRSIYGSNTTLDQAFRFCRGVQSNPDAQYKARARQAVEALQKMEYAAGSVARMTGTDQSKYKADLLSKISTQLWACLR